MRTTDERIEKLHTRARELRRKRERRRITGLGSLSAVLTVLLVVCLARVNEHAVSLMSEQMTGSSLLGESTGGYVLAGIVAFFLGVIVTSVIIQHRKGK